MMDKDWGREVDRPIPLPGAENITDGRQPVRRVRGAIGGQGENLDNLDNLIPQYDQITLQQGNLVENYNLGLDLAIGHQSGGAEPACLIGAAEAAGQIIAADTENQISINEADVTRAAGSTATSTTDATTAISATSTSTSITAAELTTDTAGKERSGGPGEGKQSISRAGHAAQGAGTDRCERVQPVPQVQAACQATREDLGAAGPRRNTKPRATPRQALHARAVHTRAKSRRDAVPDALFTGRSAGLRHTRRHAPVPTREPLRLEP